MEKQSGSTLTITPAADIQEVLARMDAISTALPQTDGLACFNFMYSEVTRAVAAAIGEGGFYDPGFIARLDVLFANLYFEAVNLHFQNADRVPRAWLPLLESRQNAEVSPMCFALAGMNAHINHDLCIAVVRACEERALAPEKGSAQHQDFLRVNQILKSKESELKTRFLSGFLALIEQPLSGLGDAIAMWNIEEARNLAWDNALILWHLRSSPELTADYLSLLERSVGVASRGLLVRAL